MRHLVLIGLVVCVAGVAAQRMTTNPADGHLKTLFPDADFISPHSGSPLHWKIYEDDPRKNSKAQPIGLAWWSTDVMPLERGYAGPTHMFVGMNMSGIIVGAITDYSPDPYAFFSVEPETFVVQFKGKSIRSPFRVGEDIHAVSRATLTVQSATRAVRDSARTMAKLFLNPTNVK